MSSYKAPERNTAAFISSYHSKKVIEADHTHSESGVSLSASNTFTGSLTTFNNSIRAAYDTGNSLSYFSHAAIGSNGNFSDHAYFGHLDQISTGTYGNYAILQSNAGATYVGAAADQVIGFRFNNSTKMLLTNDGNLAIGTTQPFAKLHINGVYTAGNINMTTRNWIKHTVNSTNVQRSTNTTGLTASIYASGDIVSASHLISAAISGTSDRRIKQNIVDVDDGSALETLRLLKPKKYEYKDTFSKTQSVVWGFIAQEVAETLPYATHTGKNEIPNIYQVANVSNGNHLTFATDIELEYDASGALINELLLYDASDNRIDTSIVEAVSATELRVASETSLPNEVFVYGQKVDDFHYLDKQAIFTVGISALQEVDRQLQAEKAKTVCLETQMASLLERVSALET